MPKGVYKRKPLSQEHRRNIGEGNKGRISPMKGKKHSDETKLKIKESVLRFGYKPTEEFKKRLSQIMTGRKHSEKTKKKLSVINTGKKHSPESRRKMGMRGAKNPAWRGGRVSLVESIRKSIDYSLWREAIFRRDNWTCVWCYQRGCKIQADHINPFANILKENNIQTLKQALSCKELWNIDNGRTLCKECHSKTATHGWRTYNQLRKFYKNENISRNQL